MSCNSEPSQHHSDIVIISVPDRAGDPCDHPYRIALIAPAGLLASGKPSSGRNELVKGRSYGGWPAFAISIRTPSLDGFILSAQSLRM
jgi:hypothetical protein